MLSVDQAFKLIIDEVKPLQETEFVNLNQAINRILGENIYSPLDFPYTDNSAMDGYAVKFQDVVKAQPSQPIILEVIEEIPAGYVPQKTVNAKQCSRIFTGGMMPPGADTIVIQEETQLEGNLVKVLHSPKENDFVRKKGAFYRANDCLLTSGIKINPPEMAILAMVQKTNVPVVRSPLVAILSTGDELISPSDILTKGKLVDSNQYLLSSFVSQNGAIPLAMGIIPDDKEKLEGAIANALEKADFVFSTGGVSVGDYDYVTEVLRKLGGEILMEKVSIKPGKPLTVAVFPNHKIYFGIPGNPVSTMVICWRFLQSAIAKLSNNTNYESPAFIESVTQNNLHSNGQRETYLWGKAEIINGIYQFTLAQGLHNSGNLVNLQQTNALAKIPIGVNQINFGQKVEIMLVNKI